MNQIITQTTKISALESWEKYFGSWIEMAFKLSSEIYQVGNKILGNRKSHAIQGMNHHRVC